MPFIDRQTVGDALAKLPTRQTSVRETHPRRIFLPQSCGLDLDAVDLLDVVVKKSDIFIARQVQGKPEPSP